MKLYYRLYEKDYLQHQLYLASISPRIQKKRKDSYFWILALFTLIAVFAFLYQNNLLGSFSLIASVITALFYPIYQRKQYEKHYSEFIKENYPDKQDENSYVEFTDNELIIHNEHSESRLDYSKIDKFVEIRDYIFVRIGTTSLIIPTTRIDNATEVQEKLVSLAKIQSKEYIKNISWKWK